MIGRNTSQVQHNSVELAMEWLINHPEEEAPAGQAAGAEAEGAGPEADIAGSFPQPAEEDVASSSTGPVSPSCALFCIAFDAGRVCVLGLMACCAACDATRTSPFFVPGANSVLKD